jgi:hypothetical protein
MLILMLVIYAFGLMLVTYAYSYDSLIAGQ